MKKERFPLLIFIIFFMTTYSAIAQEKIVLYDPSPYNHVKNYGIGGVFDLDNLIGVAVINQGYISVPRVMQLGAIKITGGSRERYDFNKLSLYTFRYSGALLNEWDIFYTMHGDTLYAGRYATEDDSLIYSKPFSQMIREFPMIFNPRVKEKYFFKKHDFSTTVSKHVFNPYTVSYVPEGYINIHHKHHDPNNVYRRSNDVLIDSVSNRVTIVYGRTEKGVRYNELKEFHFVTKDNHDKITGDFKLEFDFPRSLHSELIVYDNRFIEPKPVGKLFVFTYQQMLSSKQADPVKNNFNIIYTDVNGNQIFNTNSTFETIERAVLHVNGAFYTGENLILQYTVTEKNNREFGIARFKQNGEAEYVKIPLELAVKSVEGIRSTEDAEFLKTRTLHEGVDGLPGLRIGFDTKLKLCGSFQTSDAHYFWGHTIYIIDDPVGPPKRPDGSIPPGPKPQISLTGEFMVLRYDKDFNLKKIHFHNLPLSKEGYKIYPADIRGKNLFFVIPLISPGSFWAYNLNRKLYDEKKAFHTNYPYLDFYNPLVISFVEGDPKNKIFRDMFLLSPDKPFIYSNNFISLAILGFSITEDKKTLLHVVSMDDMIE